MGFWVIAVLVVAMTAAATELRDTLDPSFQKIAFDDWLREKDTKKFRWTVVAGKPRLSFHQRMEVMFDARVDGRDLADRNQGQLVFFIQVTDAAGVRYQSHGTVELSKFEDNLEKMNIQFLEAAFMLPGEYRLSAAVLHTASGDHSARELRFRVGAPGFAVPGDWKGLPPVEFIEDEATAPESWFLPKIRNHGELAKGAGSRLNVLLNIGRSETLPAGPGFRRRRQGDPLEGLLPQFKYLATAEVERHFEIVDLARRKTPFVWEGGPEGLQWPEVKAGLEDATTASIDVKSLSERHANARFFVNRVRRILSSEGHSPGVVVVLSPPIEFESGEDLEPISTEGLAGARVFYLRFAEAPRAYDEDLAGMGPRRMGPPRPMRPGMGRPMGMRRPVVDQLAATLKPLNPRVIDVTNSEQMARALVEVEKALATR